jgi:hypothetical protein
MMDVGEIGRSGIDSVNLVQDRDQWRALVNMVMTNEPSGSIKCWETHEQLNDFSRMTYLHGVS